MHPDQVEITVAQAAALIADQAPALAGHELVPVTDGGTDNVVIRVGQGAAARFPLRAGDPAHLRERLEQEAAAAAELHSVSPVPAPEPLLVGEPGHGYPYPWLLQTWVEGETATPTSCSGSHALARDLAALVTALRRADTRGRRFSGGGRGGDLAAHDPWVQLSIERSEGLLDTAELRGRWDAYRTLPRTDADVMSHGDLIPGNVLVRGCRLVGVLDTGSFQPADPALDLVCAWHLLDEAPRTTLRAQLGCDDLQWERGQAWAFVQAVGAYWYYRDTHPEMAAMGRTTLQRVLREPPVRRLAAR